MRAALEGDAPGLVNWGGAVTEMMAVTEVRQGSAGAWRMDSAPSQREEGEGTDARAQAVSGSGVARSRSGASRCG